MPRFTTSALAIAALLGSLIVVDTAEAAKSRSVQERRQSPGKGYFAPKTSTNRSYSKSSNRSMFGSTPSYAAARNVAPRTYSPAPTYAAPSYGTPSAPFVQQHYSVPGNVVGAPRVFYSSPVVTSQPRVIYSSPVVTSQPRVIYGSPVVTSQPMILSQPQIISERVISPSVPAASSSDAPHIGQGQPASIR